jgi:hypothetical protein
MDALIDRLKVVVEVLLRIMVEIRCLPVRFVIEALVISMCCKTMNVRIPVKNHLSAKFATKDSQEIII